ncbi:MAG: thioredoxin family protein [Polyangiaceae bacterium]
MAATSSTTLPLGAPRPPVRLIDAVSGAAVDFDAQAAGKRGALVMFLCNHCPYVVHVRKELVRVAHHAMETGIAVVAINSNDKVAYPQDGPAAMASLAREEKWRFAFLFDESQDVARAFDAQCTPDLYLFDAQGKLAYHGQLDDSRPANGKPVTGRDLQAAVDAVAAGKGVDAAQAPCVGCNIKWK